MVLLLMKKITLFSKIQAVRAHEVKLVSWASQLSLQALEYINVISVVEFQKWWVLPRINSLDAVLKGYEWPTNQKAVFLNMDFFKAPIQ
jgi:hypothetical protein